jgi:hypothetical protein
MKKSLNLKAVLSGNGSRNFRLRLPTDWVEELELEGEIEIVKGDKTITIQKLGGSENEKI